LDENNFNQLWVLIHDFVKEMTLDGLDENITQDSELLLCYQCILDLVNYSITCANEEIQSVYEDEHNYLYKTILLFQKFYSTNFKYKVNI